MVYQRMPQVKRFILREERSFTEVVEGTFHIPAVISGINT